MPHQLAQLNIARFRLPVNHSANSDFVNNLDTVNAAAESASGFLWRFIGSPAKPEELHPYTDQRVIVNLSVWKDQQSLFDFTYKNELHTAIMKRRKEWFNKMDFHLVLWWVEEGHRPTVAEADTRLQQLAKEGSSPDAFTFKQSFAAPD